MDKLLRRLRQQLGVDACWVMLGLGYHPASTLVTYHPLFLTILYHHFPILRPLLTDFRVNYAAMTLTNYKKFAEKLNSVEILYVRKKEWEGRGNNRRNTWANMRQTTFWEKELCKTQQTKKRGVAKLHRKPPILNTASTCPSQYWHEPPRKDHDEQSLTD